SIFSATYNTTIVSGGSQVVTVKFTPTAGQIYLGNFTINTNAGVTNVWLSGTGIAAAPILNVSPTSLNFGNVSVGFYGTMTFTISNPGNAPLIIHALRSSDNSIFSATYNTTIVSGGSQVVT